ncbi:MAG: carboxypeptidase-like regulatory domain-containing protein [Planctomycetota bacterium]
MKFFALLFCLIAGGLWFLGRSDPHAPRPALLPEVSAIAGAQERALTPLTAPEGLTPATREAVENSGDSPAVRAELQELSLRLRPSSDGWDRAVISAVEPASGFSLDPAVVFADCNSHTVEGIVFDASGDPVEGVRVCFAGPRKMAQASTGRDGFYRLSLAAGNYRVMLTYGATTLPDSEVLVDMRGLRQDFWLPRKAAVLILPQVETKVLTQWQWSVVSVEGEDGSYRTVPGSGGPCSKAHIVASLRSRRAADRAWAGDYETILARVEALDFESGILVLYEVGGAEDCLWRIYAYEHGINLSEVLNRLPEAERGNREGRGEVVDPGTSARSGASSAIKHRSIFSWQARFTRTPGKAIVVPSLVRLPDKSDADLYTR